MDRNINKIKIHANDNILSNETAIKLKEILLKHNYELVDNNPDLSIAIGGDGSCLRMIKASDFNSDVHYVGVNAGTLGFLQEIKVDDIELFVQMLNENKYKVEEVGIQETEIITAKETFNYLTLNEIVIREKELNTVILEIRIDGACMEKYIGDGILIATSIGSTAYNLSFGGSMVYNKLHTLQITPIAPLNNKAYRNLLNSVVIPENTEISIIPIKKNLLLSIDGTNIIFNDVISIKTAVKNKRIKFLRLEEYNFYEKINEKFLAN